MEIPFRNVRGWKARQSAAAQRKLMRQQQLGYATLRAHITALSSAQSELDRAREEHDQLAASITAKRQTLEAHRYTKKTDEAVETIRRLTFAVDHAAPMLADAEAKVAAAELNLAGVKLRHDDAMADAAAAERGGIAPQVEAVEVEAVEVEAVEVEAVEVEAVEVEPVDKPARGRGRPPKVAA